MLEVALGKLRLQHVVGQDYIAVDAAPGLKTMDTPSTTTPHGVALDRPVTFTFSQWTTLETLRREWQRILGLTILVDWPALADRGLQPASRIQCSVVNRPLSEAVTAMLDPLGLTWRAIEETAIQITVGE